MTGSPPVLPPPRPRTSSPVTHSGYRATTTRPKPQRTYEMLRLGLESENRVIPALSLDALPAFVARRQLSRGAIHAPLIDDPADQEDQLLYALEVRVQREN